MKELQEPQGFVALESQHRQAMHELLQVFLSP